MNLNMDDNTSTTICIVIGILCLALVFTRFIGCAKEVEQNRHLQRMEKIEKGTAEHPHR